MKQHSQCFLLAAVLISIYVFYSGFAQKLIASLLEKRLEVLVTGLVDTAPIQNYTRQHIDVASDRMKVKEETDNSRQIQVALDRARLAKGVDAPPQAHDASNDAKIDNRVDPTRQDEVMRSSAKTKGDKVAMLVPVHPRKDEFGKSLAQSFMKFVDDRDAIDLHFIYTDADDRRKSPIPQQFKFGLPTLEEMANLDAGVQWTGSFFHKIIKGVTSDADRMKMNKLGGKSDAIPGHNIADIKQLYAIREACSQRPLKGHHANEYKYVIIMDSESLLVRKPPTGGKSMASLLDEIYNKREFFSGVSDCAFHFSQLKRRTDFGYDRLTKGAASWMRRKNLSAPLKGDRTYETWDPVEVGYPWWNQLPFLKCQHVQPFLIDIGFPPRQGEHITQTFIFNQIIYFSWLWARHSFLPRRPTGIKLNVDECPSCWCGMEYISKACDKFPVSFLNQMSSLWVPNAMWEKRGKSMTWLNTSVFLLFHMDRDASRGGRKPAFTPVRALPECMERKRPQAMQVAR